MYLNNNPIIPKNLLHMMYHKYIPISIYQNQHKKWPYETLPNKHPLPTNTQNYSQ